MLFVGINGSLPSQKYYSKAWSDFANQIGMPDLDFQGLRHTHASQLIDAGVDIVTISKRLGHSKPDITLRIYAHLFREGDSKAAAAINAALNHLTFGTILGQAFALRSAACSVKRLKL